MRPRIYLKEAKHAKHAGATDGGGAIFAALVLRQVSAYRDFLRVNCISSP